VPFFVDKFCGFSGLRPFCRQKTALFDLDPGSVLAVDKKSLKVAILSTKWLFLSLFVDKIRGLIFIVFRSIRIRIRTSLLFRRLHPKHMFFVFANY